MKPFKIKTKDAIVEIAKSQLGVCESPPNSNKVKYNTWYYGREVSGAAYPWCMAFVEWVFNEAGFKLFKTASCSAMVNQYKTKSPKQIIKGEYQVGDIIFFDFSGKKTKTEHVGICVGVNGSQIITIEGNTSISNNSNGREVMQRARSLSSISCAIRPTYAE